MFAVNLRDLLNDCGEIS